MSDRVTIDIPTTTWLYNKRKRITSLTRTAKGWMKLECLLCPTTFPLHDPSAWDGLYEKLKYPPSSYREYLWLCLSHPEREADTITIERTTFNRAQRRYL